MMIVMVVVMVLAPELCRMHWIISGVNTLVSHWAFPTSFVV